MSHRISIVLVATSVTIVGALGILILGGFIFQPRRHRNDRMLAAGALKALGVALDHYAGGTFKPLPERVGEIPSEFGNITQMECDRFVYLGPSGLEYGVLAVEKHLPRFHLFGHWMDDRLAVLRTNYEVVFIPTNRLPATVVRFATTNN